VRGPESLIAGFLAEPSDHDLSNYPRRDEQLSLEAGDLGRSRADRCQLVVTEPGVLDLKEGSTSTVGIAEQRWSSR
jgi:hypothetical protein